MCAEREVKLEKEPSSENHASAHRGAARVCPTAERDPPEAASGSFQAKQFVMAKQSFMGLSMYISSALCRMIQLGLSLGIRACRREERRPSRVACGSHQERHKARITLKE